LKPILEEVHGGGLNWEFCLYCQPATSPDGNLNDLAFFVSTKPENWKNPGRNIAEMVMRFVAIFEN
jgi:hypothetical protein